MKIRKGDTIKIITGKDKDKTGKILKILPKKNKILIEGLNLYKKHIRPKRQGEKGQTVLVPRPIDVSNAMFVCLNCKKATKIICRFEADRKQACCKKCGAVIR
ncbi:50S ribosomal protein L24 [Candidatus Wolfebacteria bacterium CG03_land_8_20_14_0_80_40_12]|uniref:Large ribosomal subunit protein uL24 n=1 Tax=Candidatus Wolfebacteria bacterium CG03_land_8_20_14_0_80_40_12 TaxID=1975069 RepID=A0A2M7B691_9BACT|nr:MAG: 50S ribosomal protein L24 [Candidatus Wolfebacteria bacterium CG03_land_8_20_14_0_80_40_12]